MSFDLRKFLTQYGNVQVTYNDDTEWVVECACDREDPGKGEFHLWVNVEKHKGVCYRCGLALGDDTDIVRAVARVSLLDAMAIVREAVSSSARLDDAVSALLPDGEEVVVNAADVQVSLPEEFVRYTKKSSAPEYLWERGITPQQCTDYDIGWCWGGFFAHRIIVPIRDVQRKLVGFVARYMNRQVPHSINKVLYPKGTKTSKVLFNERLARKCDTIVVTEGVFDALRVGNCAIALFGKDIRPVQLDRLCALGAKRRIVIMLDKDARAEAEALAEHLSVVCSDVRIARLPRGRKDPGECTDVELRRAVKRARRRSGREGVLSRAVNEL